MGVAWRWVWKAPGRSRGRVGETAALRCGPVADAGGGAEGRRRSIQKTVFGSVDSRRNLRWERMSVARLRRPGLSSTFLTAIELALEAGEGVERRRGRGRRSLRGSPSGRGRACGRRLGSEAGVVGGEGGEEESAALAQGAEGAFDGG